MIILDLEASPEHLSRGTTRNVDALLLVVEPYYRSYETAKRMAALAAELPIQRVAVVANKIRNAQDAEAIREYCQMRSSTSTASCRGAKRRSTPTRPASPCSTSSPATPSSPRSPKSPTS